MGQFLIAPAALSGYVETLDARLRGQGFERSVNLSVDGYRIVTHRSLNGADTPAVTLGDGAFALHTGSFLFDGQVGEPALRAFHEAFDPARPPWDRCRGHYAVILRKDGRLWLVTDRLGSLHVYHRRDEPVFSSSFLAVADSVSPPAPDALGIYQYAWNGSAFGDRTVFENVRLLPAPTVVALGETAGIVEHGAAIDLFRPCDETGLEDIAAVHADRLRGLFADYRAYDPRPFRSALSGGYDSRLILAALTDAGINPDLFVFGRDGDPDVACAKAVAEGEGLALQHLDKSTVAPPEPDAFAEQVHRDLHAFDGLKYDGLFDSGADYADRMARESGDAVVLNGSAGEIYRNFFYLPDRAMKLDDLVSAFFSRFDPAAMTGAFDEGAYRVALSADMMAALRIDRAKVARPMIEALYPLFRGRFWSSRDVSVNQRFGRMLYPFLEPTIIEGTNNIPLRLKQFGRLEAAMIRHFSPRLAAYPTSYGMTLADEPPLRYRLKMLASIHRPVAVRRLTYRMARHGAAPPWLHRDRLCKVMDVNLPYMRALFRPDRLRDPEVLNRVLTVEFLCQRANAATFP
jgi:asparagine synthase (glutamine-hydrolysing)